MSNHRGFQRSSLHSSNSSKFLKFAEYASLTASVIGSIASAVSQQVFYAAAPLTVSLALNLADRQRLERQTQRRITTAVAQVDETLAQLNQRIDRLQQQFTAELNQHLVRLEAEIVTASTAQVDFTSSLAEFDARLTQLTQQLADEIQVVQQQLQSRSDPPSFATLRTVEPLLEQLRERITAVEAQTRQLQTQFATPELGAFDGIRQSIQQLFDRLSVLEALDWNDLIDRVDSLAPVEAKSADAAGPVPPLLRSEEEGLEELYLNLGIDFGTSFTKVCFRDIARNYSELVTFTDGTTQLEEALLPTKIGILPNGTLIAGLTATEWQAYESQVETTVELIKMRLANLDLPQEVNGWRLEQLPALDQPEMVENLCAYYLSRVINRTQHWIRCHKSDLLINQRIVWSANVGVPVAYCDSPALARFEKVLSLAWLLSNEPQTEWFTLENLATQMDELRSRLNSTSAIDCFAIPEIAAEAWSFFNSREADDGFYVFLDIGDGTLDGTAFYYYREDGEPNVNFYTAKVEPLGVTALSRLLAAELNQSASTVKATLQNAQSDLMATIHSSRSRRQIQQLVAAVIWNAKQEHFKHFPNGLRPGAVKSDFRDQLKVFLGGGGSKMAFYSQTITATHAEFKQQNAGIPPYALKLLPVPKDLTMNQVSEGEFHRFAVGYGLSLPVYEGAKVCLPSQVSAYRPQRGRVQYPAPPEKHADMKDMC
jgi:hypothetical protein